MNTSRSVIISLALFTAAIFLSGGCDKLKPRPASAPAATPAGEEVLTNAPRGRDAEDDAKSPPCLPQTQKNGSWVKKEPVRVTSAADLARLLPPEAAARCEYFRIKGAARCAYGLKRADATYARAEVIYIETLTDEDGYGLLTCLSPGGETYHIGGETRVDHAGGLALRCWQGRCYLKVSSTETDAETAEEMIRLLMHICGKIPHESSPAILAALPTEGRRPGKLWLARHLASIPSDAIELGYPLDLQKVSTILGLGKDTLIAVASYDVPGAARPNTVWIVEYPSVKSAADAYARYNRLITKTDDPIAVSASILPEQGTYLVGTWTAEEESMQYLLPKISKALPM